MILATAVLALLGSLMSKDAFESWGWRLAFLIAIPLLVVGAWIRHGVEESHLFQLSAPRPNARQRSSVVDALQRPVPILQGLGVRMGENVAFYIYTVFVIS